jgi:folate-binding protein YgfZ
MTTDLQSELAAIREGAAIAPITDRAFLRITGSDATRWLNGMVTNNIKDLAPGEGNYNFLLNAQGRIQGDCTIYREPGEGAPTFLLETDNSQLETVRETLDRFIIMDDVELTPAMTDKSGILVIGAGALGTLDVGLIWPKTPISMYREPNTFGDHWVFAHALNRYEVWGDAAMNEWIKGLGDLTISQEALESIRILSATPKYGQDIRDRDLPQETAQTHALHFAKGCYLGQEIVERIRSRGQVHRTFTQFRLTGTLPELPAPLEANGKPAGELTSAIQIGDDLIALGYARREALDTHQTLTYPGGTAAQTHISNLTSHI